LDFFQLPAEQHQLGTAIPIAALLFSVESLFPFLPEEVECSA